MTKLDKGKSGTYYTPFPVMAMAAGSDGSTFLVAGGGGAGNVKEVPNLVLGVGFDESTQTATTLASLNTGKAVIVHMSFSATAGLWLASAQSGCKVLSFDAAEGKVSELCSWTTEEEGKEPEQNFARFSSDAKTIITGGTDGVVRLWSVGKDPSVSPALKSKCGEKTKEILDGDFSADGKHVAACDASGAARLWTMESPEDAGTALQFPKPKKAVKGGVWIKLVRFCTLPTGAALILAANGARGPGLVAICSLDGSCLAQVAVDEAPVKSIFLDSTRNMLLVGITSGSKAVLSFPGLKCQKKTKPLHELPAMEVIALGEGTIVSGSGDRSLHFLDCRRGGGSLCGGFIKLLVLVIVMLMLANIGLKAANLPSGQKAIEQDL